MNNCAHICTNSQGAETSSSCWSHSSEAEPSADEKEQRGLIHQITADYNALGTAELEIIAER